VFVRRHGMEVLTKLLKCEDPTIRVPALRCIARLTEFAPYCDVFVSCRGVNALALVPVDSKDKEVRNHDPGPSLLIHSLIRSLTASDSCLTCCLFP
jgi:hypothetical protein